MTGLTATPRNGFKGSSAQALRIFKGLGLQGFKSATSGVKPAKA